MKLVRFGPSGNGELFYNLGFKDSEQAPEWLRSLGLSAYEYSFSLGRFITKEKAEKIAQKAKENDIQLSVHAPYYINFANNSEKSKESNVKYLTNSLVGAKNLGAITCVVHIGSQMKFSRQEAFLNVEKSLKEFLDNHYTDELQSVRIAPETMGKFSYIGTVDEVLEIASWHKNIIPCFDMGHINCITQGALKTKDDFKRIFDKCIDKLGFDKTNHCHIHFSKIKYGEKGEIAHLTFEDEVYGPNFQPFLECIKEMKLNPVVISESKGTQAEDSKTMSEYYKNL